MAIQPPDGMSGGRHDIRRNPALASKYLTQTRSERLARRPKSKLGPGFFMMVLASFGAAIALFVFGAAASVYAELTSDLPSLNLLTNRLTFKTTQILDRNGKLLYEIRDREGGDRIPVRLGDVDPHIVNATVATEDKDFYINVGLDPIGLARAFVQNLSDSAAPVQGASTITQQLARNVLLSEDERTERSYTRKIREAVLAVRISERYGKDEILEMYLNEVYYGHQAYGIEAAAQTYFGKSANSMTLGEASLLAGLPQAPSEYDPFVNPVSAKARQIHVLNRMVNQGYITQEEAGNAAAEKLRLYPQDGVQLEAPHFVFYVRDLLEQRYGANMLYRGGLKVTTTLNLDWNRKAEEAMRAHLENLKKQDANNSALVSINPKTGEILAMVGSKDYYDKSIDGEVNVAIARRQPGSTIKPLIYALAFSKGWAPETVVVDEPTDFPNAPGLPAYRPHNYDLKFDGPMTIRHALSNSKNIPAVKALMYVGVPDFAGFVANMGVHLENPQLYGLSLALGGGEARPLDMTAAYGALANYGVYVPPVAILRIEDPDGNVLYEYDPPPGRQVVGGPQAYMVTSILQDNTAREPLQGPNSPLKLSRPAAAKTGSTDSYKDSWLIGYTPDLVTGVWVGNTDGHPMREVLGSLGAGRIWNRFMEDVLAGTLVKDFTPPPGVREYRMCREGGGPVTPQCPHPLYEVYPEGYDWARVGNVPGLTTRSSGVSYFPGAIGQTIDPIGRPLQATAVPKPSQPQPAPQGTQPSRQEPQANPRVVAPPTPGPSRTP